MRAEDLALALGGLDESFIAPAAADMLRDEKRRAPRALKLIAIAAAAVTVAVLLLFAGLSVGKPRTPVSHPEATVRTEPGEPGGNNGGRPDLPVVKPGASPEKSTGTETETDPVATEPDTTTAPEATEPEYTEPEPTEPEPTEPEPTEPAATEPKATTVPEVTEPVTTEPEFTEPATTVPEPTEEPEVIDGISNDDFYVMLYTGFGHNFAEPASEKATRASEARKWYCKALDLVEVTPNTVPSSGGYDPRIGKSSVASLIYSTARKLEVPLPAVREWTWFDDFADGQWYSDAVFAVYRAGLLDAASERHFGTDDLISTEEAESAVRLFVEVVRNSGSEKAKVLFEN